MPASSSASSSSADSLQSHRSCVSLAAMYWIYPSQLDFLCLLNNFLFSKGQQHTKHGKVTQITFFQGSNFYCMRASTRCLETSETIMRAKKCSLLSSKFHHCDVVIERQEGEYNRKKLITGYIVEVLQVNMAGVAF